jgi:hypothetical protein
VSTVQFDQLQAMLVEHRAKVIAIRTLVSSLFQVYKMLVPTLNLHTFQSEIASPFRYIPKSLYGASAVN